METVSNYSKLRSTELLLTLYDKWPSVWDNKPKNTQTADSGHKKHRYCFGDKQCPGRQRWLRPGMGTQWRSDWTAKDLSHWRSELALWVAILDYGIHKGLIGCETRTTLLTPACCWLQTQLLQLLRRQLVPYTATPSSWLQSVGPKHHRMHGVVIFNKKPSCH